MAKEGKASLILELKENVTDGLKKVNGAVDQFKSLILGAAGAGAALIAFLVKATIEYGQQEVALARLNIALKNAGISGNDLAKSIANQADELQRSTGFADDAIISMAALGARFGFTGDQLQQLIPRVIDLAAATGMDLNNAMVVLGKSIETGTSASLRRMGVVIDDTAFKTHDLNAVLTALDAKFKGTAETLNGTTNGQLNQFKLGINDIFKALGELVNGPMSMWISKLATASNALADFLKELNKVAKQQEETGKTAESLVIIQTRQIESLKEQINVQEGFLKKAVEMGAKEEDMIGRKQEIARLNDLVGRTEKALSQTMVAAGEERKQALAKELAERRRQEEAARKQHLADVEKETQSLMQKFGTRKDRILEISQVMAEDKARILAQGLSNEEAIQLVADIKNLEELGKTNEAQLLMDQALQFAREKLSKRRIEDLSSTLNFISSLSTAKNKELAAIGKAANIAVATMDTYQAANKALASAPPPWNFALAAAVVTAGLVNVSKIVGVQLAEGGIVMPRSGGTLATIGEAGSPEAVIPLNDPRAMSMMGGTKGGTTIVIQAGAFMGDQGTAKRFAKMIDKELFSLSRNRQSVSL